MTLGHPLVDAVLADLRLTLIDLNAFRVLWSQLDFENYTEKKSEVLALELAVHRSNASRALKKLVHFGYIEEGPASAKGVGAFRLPRAVPSAVRCAHTSEQPRRIRRQIASSL